MSEWKPIETAPKDGTRVLLYVPKYGAGSGHFDQFGPESRKGWNCHSCLYKKAQPTHWMPLPAPPKEADNV